MFTPTVSKPIMITIKFYLILMPTKSVIPLCSENESGFVHKPSIKSYDEIFISMAGKGADLPYRTILIPGNLILHGEHFSHSLQLSFE